MEQNQSRNEGAHVHAITDAQEAASVESRHRLRSYGFKMALRAVLFVAGTIVAVTWNIWVGVGILAVSAVLPWIAVMDANLIGNPETDDSVTFLQAPPADQLGAGSDPVPAEGAESESSPGESARADGDIIEGSFEPDPPAAPAMDALPTEASPEGTTEDKGRQA